MKTLADFYDHLMPELPGCPTAFLDQEMVEVAREFCQQSLVWLADLDTINLEADVATYDIDGSESQSVVARVIRLTIDDEVLYDCEWTSQSPRDEPTYNLTAPFEVSSDGLQITLIEDETPSADSDDGLAIFAALKPKYGATQLPDLLLTVHLEAFRKAVLARLMAMANKPWSNPGQAAEYGSDATSRMHVTATNARRGGTGPLRTRKSAF